MLQNLRFKSVTDFFPLINISIPFHFVGLGMSIPKHSLLSGEPHDSSIGIQTDKLIHTGVMFLPFAWRLRMP